ncbi:MAG: hypothetical protein A3D65_00635 [Candidatus Lloydbacteria bacterium RIFCSPHIGHO2_02_FULL_50_13]|uniref:Prepilin-type N-terminal cleavage/methylation domain-containing protein n=1 Tax=Candidatus Lloydbacteria bacterium RIFCSPHIGHO2_02_FULL_50_13 TaxID=1798661 RepID=A0A1G2D0F5_9BACT|nr:MAG: hypothetical protein A3D65_00635 [Candidatus Lloydbacteria bacterium RIFCSPHIGHO2_02_FULL_50_13]
MRTFTAGFTLIEMIVAIGVFLIGLLIILGALVSINDAARKARSMRIVMDNLSAAIDSMSRTIRVGSDFNCGCGVPVTTPQDCPMSDDLGQGGGTCLAFEGQHGNPFESNDQIVYRLSGGRIERSVNSGGEYLPLTAPELTVSNFRFYVYGVSVNDDQPVTTLLIRGSASTTQRTATTFNIQTTVAAYTPNIEI